MENKKTSPGIIFNLEAHLPNSNSDKNKFFRCKSDWDIYAYLTREGAADKRDETSQKLIQCALDLQQRDVLNYADQRPGSSGLFDEQGYVEQKKLRAELQETRSIIWSSVISFTPELAAKYCQNSKAAQQILSENLEVLFKNSHLNYDNIRWTGAYHTNTDNPHIHLLFWEKSPQKINAKGDLKYNTKFKIPSSCFNDFKFAINRSFSSGSLDYMVLRDKIRDGLKINYKNNAAIYHSFYTELKPLLDTGVTQYGRLTSTYKRKVDKLVKTAISLDQNLNTIYNKYCNSLLNTQKEYTALYRNNNMTVPKKVQNFYDTRILDLNGRLGNQFLKLLKQYGQNKNQINTEIKKVSNNLAADTKMIKIKNIKRRNTISPQIDFFLLDATNEVLVSQNQLDIYKAKLQREGVELIDEETAENT